MVLMLSRAVGVISREDGGVGAFFPTHPSVLLMGSVFFMMKVQCILGHTTAECRDLHSALFRVLVEVRNFATKIECADRLPSPSASNFSNFDIIISHATRRGGVT